MRWLAHAGGALAAVIALVLIVGALLPRDHVAAVSARVPAPPAAVWALLTGPAAYPTWRPDVRRVELLPETPNGAAWREVGGNGPIAFAVEAAEPPSRLVTRIADADLPFGGAWEWRLTPAGDSASDVTIIERGSVHNPIFRVASRFVFGHHATMTAQLRALARHFGAEATPIALAPDAIPGGTHGS